MVDTNVEVEVERVKGQQALDRAEAKSHRKFLRFAIKSVGDKVDDHSKKLTEHDDMIRQNSADIDKLKADKFKKIIAYVLALVGGAVVFITNISKILEALRGWLG